MARSRQSRNPAAPAEGAEFPLHNGARSSTLLGKQVFAGCVRDLDAELAARIETTTNNVSFFRTGPQVIPPSSAGPEPGKT